MRQTLLPQHRCPHQFSIPKNRAGNYGSNFALNKSSRQDRRRSDKYEVNNENTNNPNTAKPRIITTIGSPPNTFIQSKPPAIFQPFLYFNLPSSPPNFYPHRTTFLPSSSHALHCSPRTLFPLPPRSVSSSSQRSLRASSANSALSPLRLSSKTKKAQPKPCRSLVPVI